MYTILSILIIIAAILLVITVLLQPGKGDMGAAFGGVSAQMGAMFGMQKTVTLLAKITRWLAVAIVVLTILLNRFFLERPIEGEKSATEGAAATAPVNQVPVNTPPDAPQQNPAQ